MSMKEETVERLRKQAEEESTEVEEIEEEPMPEQPKRSSQPREYLVLEQESGGSWRPLGPAEATTSDAAIRTFEEHLKDGKSYVAVPSRNFRPVTLKIQQQTKISLNLS